MISEKQYLEAKRIVAQYEKEQLEYEKPKERKTSIPKEQWGVHINHCCSDCGCKYGDKDCPVELGLIKQNNSCEVCYECETLTLMGR